jgi:hypothetical protein
VALTHAGSNINYGQTFSAAWTPSSNADNYWQGQTVTCGIWAKATVASTTYISITDSIGTTTSAFHSGGGAFEFLTVSRSFAAGYQIANVKFGITTTPTTSYFDSAICTLGTSITNWVPGGWRGEKSIIVLSSSSLPIPGNATTYLGTYSSTVENDVAIYPPQRCVARKFYGRLTNAPGAGESATFTYRVLGSDTNATFTISGTSKTGSDLTNEVDNSAEGRATSFKVVMSAGAVSSQASVTFECEEVPALI